LAAGLLGIFLGSFGIHNFYLGYNKRGLVQLLLTVLSCGLFSFATEIWGAVEGILILCNEHPTDAKGIPLKD
jgi:TM2 domain-containing membrane protein YozV